MTTPAMTAPAIIAIDHFHLHCRKREAAEAWYARVLGLSVIPEFAHWAQGGGPLTLRDPADVLHLALFEREPASPNPATLALRVSAAAFPLWQAHLGTELGTAPHFEDHGESRSLYFRDPDGNPWEITCYEAEAPGEGLHELLDAELDHSVESIDAQRAHAGALPESGGALSSHVPMALHALAALGADTARLQAWGRQALAQQPAALPWPELEGAERRWREELAEEGAGAVLARRLPALMPGCGAMAFHALIRTGHAWESRHPGQLARALAYWEVRSEPLPGPDESTAPALALPDWLDALLALPLPADFSQPWISVRMQRAAAEPAFQALAPRLALQPGLLHELARWLAGAYADSGNFTLLHGLTASRALTILLPLLPPAARPAALRAFTGQLAAALQASRWRGERMAASTPPREWPALVADAIGRTDAHAIKLTHAAWHLGRLDSDPVWRRAAEAALR
jgi:catechol 2,3-dioxygenase-like lactoylglutathione lyase family enzyme